MSNSSDTAMTTEYNKSFDHENNIINGFNRDNGPLPDESRVFRSIYG